MVLFRDMNKASSDLLTKGYPHEKAWDLECKYKSKNPEIVNTASVGPGGGFEATSKMKYMVGNVSTEVKMMANGKSTIDLKYAMPQLPGLNLGAKLDRRGDKAMKDCLDVSAEYQSSALHSYFSVNPFSSSFTLNSVCQYKTIKLGSEVYGKVDVSTLKYAVGASYTGVGGRNGDFTVSLKTAPHGDSACGRLIGSVHGRTGGLQSTELAAEVEYNVMEGGRTNIQFGGMWCLNPQNDTYLKAKISQNARVSFALSHRICDFVCATIGSQLDVTKPGSLEAVKHGLKLEICA